MTGIRLFPGLLVLAILMLAACKADNNDEAYRPGTEDPIACIDLYAPVCGVIPGELQCITTPCPLGAYQTFGNACYANAQNALVLQEGECGTLEGELYYADNDDCDQGDWPVCAATTSREPCTEARCPALIHTSYDNACGANEARAPVLFEGICGELEETRVIRREVLPCPPIGYPPVCALESYSATGAAPECLSEPCFTHHYRTHYTPCSVAATVATTVFNNRECGLLEEVATTGEPPVEIIGIPTDTESVGQVVSASIDGDLLRVVLAYSGCAPQHFRLLTSGEFMESYPVQVRYSFQPVVQEFCRAHFETGFVYDLKPLKALYQEMYQTDKGTIRMPGLADYNF